MHSQKLYASIFVTLLYIIIYFTTGQFAKGLYQDEFHYLSTAVDFSSEPIPSISLLKNYNELNTPLPFIIGGWVIKIFGEDIKYLRMLTFAVSFLLVLIFIWGSPARSQRLYLALLGLILFPNYYLCSVYYYTDIFAMVFVLAGMCSYVKKAHWAGLLFFAMGICCRQYMIAFPVAIAAYELLKLFRKSSSVGEFISFLITSSPWKYYTLSILSLAPWIILWKNVAPSAVMEDQFYDSNKVIHYNFGFVMYSCVCLCIYYVLPELIFTRKIRLIVTYPRKYPRVFIGLVAIILTIVFFFPAKQAHNPYFTWPYLGYVDHVLTTIGITGIFKQLLFGILSLIALVRFFSSDISLAGCIVLFNIILLGKAQLSWDKYSLPMIMTLWFLCMFDKYWISEKKKLPVEIKR